MIYPLPKKSRIDGAFIHIIRHDRCAAISVSKRLSGLATCRGRAARQSFQKDIYLLRFHVLFEEREFAFAEKGRKGFHGLFAESLANIAIFFKGRE